MTSLEMAVSRSDYPPNDLNSDYIVKYYHLPYMGYMVELDCLKDS